MEKELIFDILIIPSHYESDQQAATVLTETTGPFL